MAFKPFEGLMKDPRDVEAPEGSTNAQLLALPQRRVHTHDMVGRLVVLPRTGIVGVLADDGGRFVVVDGSACKKADGYEAYPRGGHHITVSDLELQTAIELESETRFAVQISLDGGATFPHELEVGSMGVAEEVAKNNAGKDRATRVVQTVSFVPNVDVWPVPK